MGIRARRICQQGKRSGIICNHYSTRGKLTRQYMISDLLSLRMPERKDITFHRWFNAWSGQYHRLPDDQQQANMAVLVE